jgi:hypothetical protein
MRWVLILIDQPRFKLLPVIVQQHENIRIQTLISEAPIKTLNHRVLWVPRAG